MVAPKSTKIRLESTDKNHKWKSTLEDISIFFFSPRPKRTYCLHLKCRLTKVIGESIITTLKGT